MTAIATGAQASGGRAPRRQDARSRTWAACWVALPALQQKFQHTVGWRNGGGGLDRRPMTVGGAVDVAAAGLP